MPAKGQKQSVEAKRRIGNAKRGKPRSAEVRAKLSAALKGRPIPGHILTKRIGRRLSDSHRASISVAKTGTMQSPEHKAKLHAARVANGTYHEIGSRFVDKKGYVFIKVAHNAGDWNDNWKAEHRLIVERAIGRSLNSDEHVHHLDDNPSNNKPENLLLLSHVNHSRLNYILRLLKKGGPELLSALWLTLAARGQVTVIGDGLVPLKPSPVHHR